MHARFWIVSDFASYTGRDDRNRPHCDTGPFRVYRDGLKLYAIHGVRVPARIIEHPELVTVADIDAEPNAEVRRIMVERYGSERFVRDSGARVIDDSEWPVGDKVERGVLYRRDFADGSWSLFVRVKNGTVEPDGRQREFYLRPHPELRPLPDPADPNAELGEPQPLTALAAVASTFGLRAEEYRLVART